MARNGLLSIPGWPINKHVTLVVWNVQPEVLWEKKFPPSPLRSPQIPHKLPWNWSSNFEDKPQKYEADEYTLKCWMNDCPSIFSKLKMFRFAKASKAGLWYKPVTCNIRISCHVTTYCGDHPTSYWHWDVFSPGVKQSKREDYHTSPHIVLRLRISGAIHSLPHTLSCRK